MKLNEKQLALRLVRHAAFVLPRSLASWGAAMQHEIEYIEPNRSALRWALGCLSASYVQRITTLNVVQMVVTRWMLALLIASWSINDLFVAHYLSLKAAGWLGLKVQGGDATRFMTTLSQISPWSIVLDGVVGLLYLWAAYWLLQKKALSRWVLVVATGISCTVCTSHLIADFFEVGRLSADGLTCIYLTYAVQACVILLLWHGFSRDRERRNTRNN